MTHDLIPLESIDIFLSILSFVRLGGANGKEECAYSWEIEPKVRHSHEEIMDALDEMSGHGMVELISQHRNDPTRGYRFRVLIPRSFLISYLNLQITMHDMLRRIGPDDGG